MDGLAWSPNSMILYVIHYILYVYSKISYDIYIYRKERDWNLNMISSSRWIYFLFIHNVSFRWYIGRRRHCVGYLAVVQVFIQTLLRLLLVLVSVLVPVLPIIFILPVILLVLKFDFVWVSPIVLMAPCTGRVTIAQMGSEK